jgi:hypothetical protein
MDPPLGCIDPNLFQLNQLFEDVDDEAVPTIQTSDFNLFPGNEEIESVLELDPKRARRDHHSSSEATFSTNVLLDTLNEAESFIAQKAEASGVFFLKRKVPKNFGNSGLMK